MNAHFAPPVRSKHPRPPKTGPIRVFVLLPVRIKDIRNGYFSGFWNRRISTRLYPRIERGVLWLVEANGYGLPRSEWLAHWHNVRVDFECERSNGRKEFFNEKLKRDRIKA